MKETIIVWIIAVFLLGTAMAESPCGDEDGPAHEDCMMMLEEHPALDDYCRGEDPHGLLICNAVFGSGDHEPQCENEYCRNLVEAYGYISRDYGSLCYFRAEGGFEGFLPASEPGEAWSGHLSGASGGTRIIISGGDLIEVPEAEAGPPSGLSAVFGALEQLSNGSEIEHYCSPGGVMPEVIFPNLSLTHCILKNGPCVSLPKEWMEINAPPDFEAAFVSPEADVLILSSERESVWDSIEDVPRRRLTFMARLSVAGAELLSSSQSRLAGLPALKLEYDIDGGGMWQYSLVHEGNFVSLYFIYGNGKEETAKTIAQTVVSGRSETSKKPPEDDAGEVSIVEETAEDNGWGDTIKEVMGNSWLWIIIAVVGIAALSLLLVRRRSNRKDGGTLNELREVLSREDIRGSLQEDSEE
jgi:hypothetical protein